MKKQCLLIFIFLLLAACTPTNVPVTPAPTRLPATATPPPKTIAPETAVATNTVQTILAARRP